MIQKNPTTPQLSDRCSVFIQNENRILFNELYSVSYSLYYIVGGSS